METREQIHTRLKKEHFDLLIVGGGINGAAAAWDASLRGLKVALVEKGDFGASTSAGCFKIVHGGLRYLQHLDLRRLFESVEEQRLIRIIAPHLVSPLAFLIPCYKPLLKRRAVIRIALRVYETLARNRNKGVQANLVLPRHKVLSKEECLSIAPGLSTNGLEGGVLYYDVQMNNCERLTFEVLQSARAAGCCAANYLRVDACRYEVRDTKGMPRVVAVSVTDMETAEEFEISADHYINASGPWLEHLFTQSGARVDTPKLYSKGIQFIVPEITKRCAFAIESGAHDDAAVMARGGRAYFIQPWNGYSLIGTSDELVEQDPDSFGITEDDIERFYEEVRKAYAFDTFDRSSILGAFGGLRPVAEDVDIYTEGEQARVAREDLIIDHSLEKTSYTPISNVLSMRGVKYTTFRHFARCAVDAVLSKRSVPSPRSITHETPLVCAPLEAIPTYVGALQSQYPTVSHHYVLYLVTNYGRAAERILPLHASGLSKRLHEQSLATSSEVVYVLENEHVVHLDDLLFRRIPFRIAGSEYSALIDELLSIVQEQGYWDERRCEFERQRALAQCAQRFAGVESLVAKPRSKVC